MRKLIVFLSVFFFSITLLISLNCKKSPEKQAISLIKDAEEHYNKGNYDNAIFLYEKSLAIKPSKQALVGLANCYMKKDQWKDAVNIYKKFLKDNPKNYELILNIVDIYLKKAQIEDAIKGLKFYNEQGGSPKEIYYRIGLAYESKRMVDEAAFAFNKALELNQNDSISKQHLDTLKVIEKEIDEQIKLAQFYENLEQYKEASAQYIALINMKPFKIQFYDDLLRIYEKAYRKITDKETRKELTELIKIWKERKKDAEKGAKIMESLTEKEKEEALLSAMSFNDYIKSKLAEQEQQK